MVSHTIAKESMNQLNAKVNAYEWILNVVSCIALICSAMLIVPFVMIYTQGVSDTNYKQPAFAYLLCFAAFMSCIRLPYQNLVEASGHFKETRNGAIGEAVINIVISVIFVRKWGCIGVAIGTIVAMTVRTIQYAEYVFGFEESYGYLTGSYVRDKDGVDGAYMICEMFSYYATRGISLLDKLDELYKTYGYCLNTLHSYEFDGSAGLAKMQSIMQAFRGDIKEFGGKKVVKLLDYAPGLDSLPK